MLGAAKRRLRVVAMAAAALATTAGAAGAHHGWSGYDSDRLVTLTGTVQSAAFESPHALVALESEGKVWEVVLAPPSRMQRRGLPSGSIEAGDGVAVEGYPHRTESAEFRAERIRVNGGEPVELR